MDADGLGLADAVEATDALLEQLRISRQVEQHQMMGELEVTTLAADLGAEQDLGALVGVGEEGGGAVALDDRHAFVEHSGLNAGALKQGAAQIEHGLGGAVISSTLAGASHAAARSANRAAGRCRANRGYRSQTRAHPVDRPRRVGSNPSSYPSSRAAPDAVRASENH